MRGAAWGLAALTSCLLATAALADDAALGEADRAAAFAAAGFTEKDGAYVRCDDTVTMSRQPGYMETADLNGDGFPEALVKESSTFCYGNTAEAFVLVARDAAGNWTALLDQIGIPVVLEERHAGWPDIEVGGPGFGPFPLFRFDGSRYAAAP